MSLSVSFRNCKYLLRGRSINPQQTPAKAVTWVKLPSIWEKSKQAKRIYVQINTAIIKPLDSTFPFHSLNYFNMEYHNKEVYK